MYVPKPASGDYSGRTTNARKKAFVVRKKILMVLLDFFEKLDVVGILNVFFFFGKVSESRHACWCEARLFEVLKC